MKKQIDKSNLVKTKALKTSLDDNAPETAVVAWNEGSFVEPKYLKMDAAWLVELIDAIEFPIKDYRKSVKVSSGRKYVDTKVPVEMYDSIKRSILATYVKQFIIETVSSETVKRRIDSTSWEDYGMNISEAIYTLLFTDCEAGLFEELGKHWIDFNDVYETVSPLFFDNHDDIWRYYKSHIKNDSAFIELAESVLDLLFPFYKEES